MRTCPSLLLVTLAALIGLPGCGGGGGGGGGGAVAANSAPVAVTDNVQTAEDTPVTVSVLANDTNVEGDGLSVSGIGVPSSGSALGNPDGTITYTPSADFNGVDSFPYTITDDAGNSATGTVSVQVTAINDAPVAIDDSATTLSDVMVTVDVLMNDLDVDGDTLAVLTITPPAGGTAQIVAGGIEYTPAPGFQGADVFTYAASDGQVGSNSAQVLIDVLPPPDLIFSFSGSGGTFDYDPTMGEASFSVSLSLLEDPASPGFPHGVESFAMALDHTRELLDATAVNPGPALAALGGGAGPELFMPSISEEGIEVSVIVSSVGTDLLVAGTEQDVVVVDYSTTAETLRGNALGTTTTLSWSAGIENQVVVAGVPAAPILMDIAIELEPTPPPEGFHYFAPGQGVAYDPATGEAGFVESISLQEGPTTPGFPTRFDGFSIGLSSDDTLLTPVEITQGSALLAFGGGAGPDLFLSNIVPGGITVGVILDLFFVDLRLVADGPLQVVLVEYETVPASLIGETVGVVTPLAFDDDLADNVVSIDGVAEVPTLSSGSISLLPSP